MSDPQEHKSDGGGVPKNDICLCNSIKIYCLKSGRGQLGNLWEIRLESSTEETRNMEPPTLNLTTDAELTDNETTPIIRAATEEPNSTLWTPTASDPQTEKASPASVLSQTTTHEIGNQSTPRTIENEEFLRAQGYVGMTDEIAIVTKGKENIMFSMSSLPKETRVQLSYRKHEFVQLCSFNGKQCSIDRDFKIFADPTYGNCYTFNFDTWRNLTSARAGPTYGLRALLFVNTTDYLPITEASGVRITIHSQSQFPFPDVFGYSAPTGFVSSFAVKLKKVDRLPKPYGNCVSEAGAAKLNFIYEGYDYSTEGCHRSCFQRHLIKHCGCGDPRFPVTENHTHCSFSDPLKRECLTREMELVGGHEMTESKLHCNCPQPCKQTVYSATYSASRWPVGNIMIRNCNGTVEECILLYKRQAAMIEVFSEQLNYERISESEAYGWVNVLADFGGQLGLWMGISVITCVEFFAFILKLFTLCCRRKKGKHRCDIFHSQE